MGLTEIMVLSRSAIRGSAGIRGDGIPPQCRCSRAEASVQGLTYWLSAGKPCRYTRRISQCRASTYLARRLDRRLKVLAATHFLAPLATGNEHDSADHSYSSDNATPTSRLSGITKPRTKKCRRMVRISSMPTSTSRLTRGCSSP